MARSNDENFIDFEPFEVFIKLDSPKQNPKAEERVLKRERSHRLGIAINHIINDIVKNSGLEALFLMS